MAKVLEHRQWRECERCVEVVEMGVIDTGHEQVTRSDAVSVEEVGQQLVSGLDAEL